MENTDKPLLTPEVLARCALHGADERFLDSIVFIHGTEYLKFFIAEATNTEPGTKTKETMLTIAIDKTEAAEGIVIPGIPFKPFRFCSP